MPGCHVKPEQMFNLIFGFNDQLIDEVEETGTASPTIWTSSAVPTDELWVVTFTGASDTDRQATHCAIDIMEDGSTQRSIMVLFPTGTARLLFSNVLLYLTGGDTIQWRLYGTQAGDDCKGIVHGYKMKLEQ